MTTNCGTSHLTLLSASIAETGSIRTNPDAIRALLGHLERPDEWASWCKASELHDMWMWRLRRDMWYATQAWKSRPTIATLRKSASLRQAHAEQLVEAARMGLYPNCEDDPKAKGLRTFFAWRVEELLVRCRTGGLSRMRYGYFAHHNPRPEWLKQEDERREVLAMVFEKLLETGDPMLYQLCWQASRETISDYLTTSRCSQLIETWSNPLSSSTHLQALLQWGNSLCNHVVDGWDKSDGFRKLADWSDEYLQDPRPEVKQFASRIREAILCQVSYDQWCNREGLISR